jgi:2-polyprenyl-3-methyl-5-hydroxy-6-metoxy-1,4-benzoquinol methylase
VSDPAARDHYSYSHYADPETARTFDDRRFGGPIGDLVAASQAHVLSEFVGRVHGRTILDVGTGTGRAALLFARGGARVTGVDASPEMLAVARQRASAENLSALFQVGDAHQLRFHDRSFDVAVCLRVLMHAPDWRQCVAELCRVADQLVILDYPSARSAAAAQSFVRRFLLAAGRRTEAYRVLRDAEVADALGQSGFLVRSLHRQFVLPIAVHKALGSRWLTTRLERLLLRAGLNQRFGSPVTLVAERCRTS